MNIEDKINCIPSMTVGVKNKLNKAGFKKVEDFLNLIPLHYHFFEEPKLVKELVNDEITSVYLKIIPKTKEDRIFNKHKNLLSYLCKDEMGQKMKITFFNQRYLRQIFDNKDCWFTFAGKISEYNGHYSIVNPFIYQEGYFEGYELTYSSIAKTPPVKIKKFLKEIIADLDYIDDWLEPKLLNDYKLMDLDTMYQELHDPTNPKLLKAALRRYTFNKVFSGAFKLKSFYKRDENKAIPISKKDKTDSIIKELPFKLTKGQKHALRFIYDEMSAAKPGSFLIQGDVGCGKSIVAYILQSIFVENGYQSVLIAPTSILAKQHYKEACEFLNPLGVKIGLLTGDTKAKERKEILTKLKSGELDILIGTHAVAVENVIFKKLGFIIVDEEQKFGREIKNSLIKKAQPGYYYLSTTATPIPGTLATSLFGDEVKVINIKTLPKGKKPIITKYVKETEIPYEKMYEEFARKDGPFQSYILCPLITDATSKELKNVISVETAFEEVSEYFFEYPEIKIGMISGNMKKNEIADITDKFIKKEIHILCSTTIIETGFSVKDANVMAIMSPDRLGISQIHQIRGRVGRSSEQGYCYLISPNKLNEKAERKMLELEKSTDGFYLSEVDMELRGSGSLNGLGIEQSGQNELVDLILANPKMFKIVSKEINKILNHKYRNQFYKNIFFNS